MKVYIEMEMVRFIFLHDLVAPTNPLLDKLSVATHTVCLGLY